MRLIAKNDTHDDSIVILYTSGLAVRVTKLETSEKYTYYKLMDCTITTVTVTVKLCMKPPPSK